MDDGGGGDGEVVFCLFGVKICVLLSSITCHNCYFIIFLFCTASLDYLFSLL